MGSVLAFQPFRRKGIKARTDPNIFSLPEGCSLSPEKQINCTHVFLAVPGSQRIRDLLPCSMDIDKFPYFQVYRLGKDGRSLP